MEPITLLIALFWVFVALNLIFTTLEIQQFVYFFKPAVMIILIAALYYLSCPNVWLIRSMYFSLLGDIFLMLPQEELTFVPGLISFLIAHVMYVWAFHEGDHAHTSFEWRVTCFVTIIVLFFPLIRWLLENLGRGRPLDKKTLYYLRWAVGIYILSLTSMVANSIATGNVIAILGSLLFAFSDTLLCWYNFITPNRAKDFWANPVIILTYHVAQFCLFWVLK